MNGINTLKRVMLCEKVRSWEKSIGLGLGLDLEKEACFDDDDDANDN